MLPICKHAMLRNSDNLSVTAGTEYKLNKCERYKAFVNILSDRISVIVNATILLPYNANRSQWKTFAVFTD